VSANLDLVRSIYAAWERGDWSAADWADPEIEYTMVDEPGAEVTRGTTAMAAAWRAYLSAWEGYRIEADEFRELDPQRVLVIVRALGRGRGSGLELADVASARRGANVFELRDGKVTRLTAYVSCERAFADLGLEA
jgi:ketosteroid isomerase-like protein